MRPNREIIAIIVLLLLFVAGAFLLGGQGNGPNARQAGNPGPPDPSVYNDRASGSKGLFEWVGREGYAAAVWRRSWDDLPDSRASVLLVVDPLVQGDTATLTGGDADSSDSTALSAADAAPLRRWLRAGHTAILMTSRLPSGHAAGTPGGSDTFADALDIIVETTISGSGRQEFPPLQPTAETRGILSLHSDADARISRRTPDAIALFGDQDGPLILSLVVGKGRLIAIADSRFASNANLARSENAAFLANVLARSSHPGSAVLFDEYHHGEADLIAGATVWSVLGRPAQLALLQLLIAAAVLIVALAVRFGTPTPLLQGVARTSAEYVTSLASLYQRAQASTTALEVIYRQFLRDLSARLGLAPDVNLEQLAEVASRRAPLDKEMLRRLLATCEQRLDEGKVTDSEMVSLVRQMARIRKDIGIA